MTRVFQMLPKFGMKNVSSLGLLQLSFIWVFLYSCTDLEHFADKEREHVLKALRYFNNSEIDSRSRGNYEDFLNAIRAFESDISLDKAPYYEQNYDNPNAINYPVVNYPGRVVSDPNGNPVYSRTSVRDFFRKIGVADLYVYGSRNPEMFKKMQYSVINFIGFVGYQFSERDLWDLGYYTHYDAQGLEEYYSDVPNSTWANGVRDTIINNVHVTDVNTWGGVFSGKHGINSFDDFKKPELQEFIALDHFQYKYNRIVSVLAGGGKTLDDYIGAKLYWNRCVPKISPPPGGRGNEVVVTISGLLAGAHLRGAEGVASLLIDHQNHADEIGTTVLQYVQDYAGYDTPFPPDAVSITKIHVR